MLKYIIKRLLSLLPVVIIISIILFASVKMMPGDQVKLMIGEPTGNSPEDVERYEKLYRETYLKLGLDKSYVEQYFKWVGNTLGGELGVSTSNNNQDVSIVIQEPLKNSIVLNIISLVLSFLIAIPVGIISAVKRGSFFDNTAQVASLIFMSMPVFFIGMCLIFIFPVTLGWGEFGGMPTFTEDANLSAFAVIKAWIPYLILPVTTLTIGSLAGTIRYVRNAMLEVIKKDYIRTARSKGLSEKVVIYSHAFRNALIPVVTIVAGSLVGVFGGSAITEQIFAYNGIGYVLIQALTARDFNLILAMNMFYAVLSLLANLIMDLSYALVDPRVRLD